MSSKIPELDPTAHLPRPESRKPWEDLDRLQDSHDLVAIISQRRAHGEFTIAIHKEFQRDGRIERTSFIPEDRFDSFRSLFELAARKVAEIKKSGTYPFPIRAR